MSDQTDTLQQIKKTLANSGKKTKLNDEKLHFESERRARRENAVWWKMWQYLHLSNFLSTRRKTLFQEKEWPYRKNSKTWWINRPLLIVQEKFILCQKKFFERKFVNPVVGVYFSFFWNRLWRANLEFADSVEASGIHMLDGTVIR